ncbi:MAG: diguanylate cyclase, partial [Candidatus Adiutrix sp.]|nr:diguanylate cyclase [Candidatus Adiutrix sp.]
MRVGVGYSENPDTTMGGMQAAMNALKQAGQEKPCDLALLFATARHDARLLRDAVISVVGPATPIVGGAAVGAISNDHYGYAGDQIILAAIWLEGVGCEIVVEGELAGGERETGRRLGVKLAALGLSPSSQAALFYDAIDATGGGVRMLMATPLLAGLEDSLGFLPDLVGAGLMGDYTCSPTMQWIGDDVAAHQVLALVFGPEVRIDSTIMHGCLPATGYYTVTKADRQTILEINGRPALKFVDELLGSLIPPESYAFFLIFGVNQGGKWDDFDEKNYASRLCLAIDRERDGIVMFEPDMVEGVEFQIMFRSLDLSYIPPRIESLFAGLG